MLCAARVLFCCGSDQSVLRFETGASSKTDSGCDNLKDTRKREPNRIGSAFLFALLSLVLLKTRLLGAQPGYPTTAPKDPWSGSYISKRRESKVNALCRQAVFAKEASARRSAKKAVVDMGEHAMACLRVLCRKRNDDIQVMAAKLLIELKDPGAPDLLLSIVKEKGHNANKEILKLLARLKDKRALKVFLDMLPGADPEMRRTLFYCLTRYTDPSTFDVLSEGLFEQDRLIRWYSYYSLKKNLKRVAEHDGGAKKEWKNKLDKLVKRLSKDIQRARESRDLPRMIRRVELLGLTATEEAADILARLIEDESTAVRAAVVAALGNVGARARGHADEILDALEDNQLIVRLKAMQAAAQIGDTRAVPLIAEQLRSSDFRTKKIGAKALQSLTGENFGPYPDLWLKWWEEKGE